MPFLLSCVTRLLAHLESVHSSPAETERSRASKTVRAVTQWFDTYREDIANNPHTLLAIYGVLLPGLRCDRVYGIREEALAKVLVRIMGLGKNRARPLLEWRSMNAAAGGVGVDFAGVVERVMRETETSKGGLVAVEELDEVLDRLAGLCHFAGQELKRKAKANAAIGKPDDAYSLLGGIWDRLASWEGKWVVRVILRNLGPLEMPETAALDAFHFLLPKFLAVRSTLRCACFAICEKEVVDDFPPHPSWDKRLRYLELAGIGGFLRPEVGVKVGRGEFVKAVSTKHAVRLAIGRRMVVERKYDGEYCQVHLDLVEGGVGIKLFSKSGRDSTRDRIEIHRALKEAFKLDSPSERRFQRNCILEGEIVVYNSREKKIMPFFHLRQHIARSGRFIGNANDSRRDPDSHLMILLFDVLLLDDRSLLSAPFHDRMLALSRVLVSPLPGQCELVQCEAVDFSDSLGAHRKLRHLFAKAIVKRWEGLILKPYDLPYVDISRSRIDKTAKGHGFRGSDNAWIKLKKDYIQGLGDTCDFCIVGAISDTERAWSLHQAPGKLNKFYAAALLNKDDIKHLGVTPQLQIIFEVTYSITKPDQQWIQQLAYFTTVAYSPGLQLEKYELSIHPQLKIRPPTHVFTHPLIFEITGGGFDRPTDCNFFVPRHPRVKKIHWDRLVSDAVGFAELQEMAEDSIKNDEPESQEERIWVARLERGDLGRQLTATPKSTASQLSEPTPSPCKRRKVERVGSEGNEGRSSTPVLTPLVDRRRLHTPLATPPALESTRIARRLTFTSAPAGSYVSPAHPNTRATQPGSFVSAVQTPVNISAASCSSPIRRSRSNSDPTNTSIRKRKIPELSLTSPHLTSPITNSTVFLIPALAKFPSLFEKLVELDVGVIHQLNLVDGDGAGFSQVIGNTFGNESSGNGSRNTGWAEDGCRKVVLVDPQLRRSDTRRVVRKLKEWKERRKMNMSHEREGAEEGRRRTAKETAWEIYDWRVCDARYHTYTTDGVVDWELHKLCEV